MRCSVLCYIQVRWRLDKSFVRWMPHINLLYPFLDVKDEKEQWDVAQQAYQVTKLITPFQASPQL